LFNNALAVGAYVGKQEIHEQEPTCAANVINAQSIPGTTKQAFYDLATQGIAEQIGMTPDDARIYTLGGSFYEQIGAFTQATKLLEKAHTLSPQKQTIDIALGTAYINLGAYSKAVDILKQAYEEEPSFTDARDSYVTALIVAGRDAEAHTLFGNDPAVFDTEQTAQAYTIAKEYDKAIGVYKNIIGTSTDNYNDQLLMAKTQYIAGYKYQAVQTLKDIETAHPEFKSQIDEMIKQVQGGN
jgi:tetratricopeptide (TPR) repeat protein